MASPRSSGLIKAVAAAFTKAAITPSEQQIGMTHGDLPWICPPLLTSQYLGRLPLQEYYDFPMQMDTAQVMPFWISALHDLAAAPSAAVDGMGLVAARRLMPTERAGMRAFRFSVPNGYPGLLDETSGVMLSLELAQAVFLSLPTRRRVSDESNFFVEMEDGKIIGVVGGQPAVDSYWSFDASFMVQDMLAMPRGAATVGCWYDSLSYARSLLHTYRGRFPDFDAVDSAVQALRYMSMGAAAPELLLALHVSPHVRMQMSEKVRQLEDAVSAAEAPMSDRDKIATIRAALVPAVISATEFRAKIYASYDVPFTLDKGKMEKIHLYLVEKLEKLRALL